MPVPEAWELAVAWDTALPCQPLLALPAEKLSCTFAGAAVPGLAVLSGAAAGADWVRVSPAPGAFVSAGLPAPSAAGALLLR
jgi:hypothetical protein